MTAPPRVHVIGAGVSGLAAAVALAASGRVITVYEAAAQAGGRCRSYLDDRIGRRIDNGNHLLLSGNRAAGAFLAAIGAGDLLAGPARAIFPFVDLTTGERWTVRPNAGPLPWWIFDRRRRIPGTRAGDYLRGLRLARASKAATVADCLGREGAMVRRFWEPLAVAALNTEVERGAASLLWPVVRETFGRGEAACRPRIAREGLSETFIDPAIATLRRQGVGLRLRTRVRALDQADAAVTALILADGERVRVGPGDAVIVAVPPQAAAGLLPMLTVPLESRPIVNGHFLLASAQQGVRIIGLTGGLSQWLFIRGDVASVTVSAANGVADQAPVLLAERMWREVGRVLGLAETPLPVYRIVKEKRATFAQTPEQVGRRPGCRTPLRNVFLAGDWTDTGLPATIEGSVRSGNTAADAVRAATASA